MRWINRGSEPPELKAIRRQYTIGWVNYNLGSRAKSPSDSRWRDFREILEERFHYKCGYCEEINHCHVDHFRPKESFPKLVYAWRNWVLACPHCNCIGKKNQWPTTGYVNPCDTRIPHRPDRYFDYDCELFKIIPRKKLSGIQLKRALTTIEHLKLNSYIHRKRRANQIKLVNAAFTGYRNPIDQKIFIKEILSPQAEFSHFVRAYLRSI